MAKFVSSFRGYGFHKKDIHAGVTVADMEEFLRVPIEQALLHPDDPVYVYLDEINTAGSLQWLFKEMIGDQMFNGTAVPDNVRFIAALNPYRPREAEAKAGGLHYRDYSGGAEHVVDAREAMLSSLVYRVHELPPGVLPYVWNFTSPHSVGVGEDKLLPAPDYVDLVGWPPLPRDATEETIYTRLFCVRSMHRLTKDAELRPAVGGSKDLWQGITFYIISAIDASNRFVRNNRDTSSVSLRDCDRSARLVPWMFRFLRLQKRSEDEGVPGRALVAAAALPAADLMLMLLDAIFLTLFVEYEMRLPNEERVQYFEFVFAAVDKSCVERSPRLPGPWPKDVRALAARSADTIRRATMLLVKYLNLEHGIARNQGLVENTFAMFVCVVNCIPVSLR